MFAPLFWKKMQILLIGDVSVWFASQWCNNSLMAFLTTRFCSSQGDYINGMIFDNRCTTTPALDESDWLNEHSTFKQTCFCSALIFGGNPFLYRNKHFFHIFEITFYLQNSLKTFDILPPILVGFNCAFPLTADQMIVLPNPPVWWHFDNYRYTHICKIWAKIKKFIWIFMIWLI